MTDVKDIPLKKPALAEEQVEEQQGWPVLRLVGHLEGVRKRDVYAYLKGLVVRHFQEHGNEHAFVSMTRWRNGWLYELCLGGDGKSRVKPLATFMDDNPAETRIKLPAGQRYGEVYLHSEGRVVYRLLPEGEHPNYKELKPSGTANKLYPSYNWVIAWGSAMFMLGCGVLALGVGMSALGEAKSRETAIERDEERSAIQRLSQFEALPLSHVPSLESLLNEPRAKEYIEAIRFEEGQGWLPPQIGCVGSECPTAEESSVRLGGGND